MTARCTLNVARVWLILASAVYSAAAAQSPPQDTVRLAEIVITPTRVATPRASVAAAITVLSGEDLRRRGITTLAEALRDVAGTAVAQPGSFGALASLFLRGGESDYTSVLVDGVPLNDPGGAVSLADLTTDNVERVEIVRGPASVLYGSDAVSGVVQVFTRQGRGPPRMEAGVESGLFEAVTPGSGTERGGPARSIHRWQVATTGGNDAAGFTAGVSRTSTAGLYGSDGFDNSYRNTVASALLRAAPDDRSDASLSLRYGDHAFHYPTDGAGQLADANQVAHGTSTSVGLDVGRFLLPRVEARLMLAGHTTDGAIDDAPDDTADTLGFYAYASLATVERKRAEVRANIYGPAGVVSLGALVERQSQRSFSESKSAFGNSTDRLNVQRRNHAAYVQVQGDPVRRVSLNGGARVDESATFGTFLTYRGGAVYRPGAGLRLRVAAGTGFKEPTFYENFAVGFARGNPGLKPEHSTSWEVAFEQSLPVAGLGVSATYFSQRFRDMVDFTFAPPGPTDPNYFNVAAADSRGIELEARAAPAPRLALEARYTWLRTKVVNGGFDTGPGALLAPDSTLLRRPAHTVSGVVRLRASARARGALDGRYIGGRDDLDYAAYPYKRVALPGYTTFTLSAAGDVLRAGDRSATLTLRIENLLDAAYEEAAHFPARGRTVWLGMTARF